MLRVRQALFLSLSLLAGFASPLAQAEISSNNPQDYVGVAHNDYLDCLRKFDPYSKRNPLEVLVYDCGLKTDSDPKEFIERYTAMMPQDLLAPLDELVAPYRDQFTDEQYSYFAAIERILSTQSPDDAARSLEQLENAAVKALGREPGDLSVLSGLATARHSLDYWTHGNGANRPTRMKAKWWQVILADAVGGLVGSLGGPAGTVGLGAACSGAVANL